MRYIAYILFALLAVSCGQRQAKGVTEGDTVTKRHFERGTAEDYWGKFDFGAGERVAEYDTTELIYAMADYVMMIEPADADSLLRGLMHRAEASRPVLDIFAMVTEMVLHNPNSPLRNDEYYIPILEVLVASPLYDEYDRIAPAYDLEMVRKNRIGTVATDFVYTLADGEQGRLSDIVADYTIVIFSNPGCPMCRDIRYALEASPLIGALHERGSVAIITLYPDEDIVAWRDHLAELPARWINGYDKELRITTERLYNLNAIPSLYLLDKDKRVIIKDGSSVAQIEGVIATMEADR